METAPVAPPRVGLWGTFDVENLGDVLFPRIARAELSRRLPGADLRAYSPYGRERPNAFDGEEPAEPLGAYRPERLAELAGELDVVVVGGGEIVHGRDELLARIYGVEPYEVVARAPGRFFVDALGPDLERRCPVLWHAVGIPFDIEPDDAARYRRALAARPYVSVRDEASRRRLERAGVDREIAVVPDPAVLLPRLFPSWDLDRRLEQVRILGWYPEDAPALVVQGSESMLGAVDELAPAIARIADDRRARVVLVETGPARGDGRFADAMAARLGERARHASDATVEDVLAAIAGSAGFIGSSLHGNLAAFVYGRPHAILAWDGESKLEEVARMLEREEALASEPSEVATSLDGVASIGARPDLLRALQRRADAHFDRLAEEADRAAARRADRDPDRVDTGAPELRRHLEGVWSGYAALARRVAADRVELAKRVEDRDRRNREDAERFEQEIRDRDEEIAALRRTLAAERERLEGEVAGREEQIRALLNTRTYRYTAFLRRVWGRLRRLGRR